MDYFLSQLHFVKVAPLIIPILLGGVSVVIKAVLGGFLLSLIMGILIALGRIMGGRIIQVILYFFLEVVRGTPLLVQLVYMYYVMPLIITLFMNMAGIPGTFSLDALTAGIWGLGINYSCYISEVIRGGVLAVGVGQMEGALSLGFNRMQSLVFIILPQAVKAVIPALGNYLIMMVKDTSLLAYVAVNELLLRTQVFASQTFYTIEAYTYLAIAYLIISVPLSHLVRYLEYRLKQN